MRTLAVTGGIGSGKSYVVRMFAALGIPVYDADLRTKRLYDEDRGPGQAVYGRQDILGQMSAGEGGGTGVSGSHCGFQGLERESG